MIIPLKNVQGFQLKYNSFGFCWDQPKQNGIANYWIYCEYSRQHRMYSYNHCLYNRCETFFDDIVLPIDQVCILRFLVFATDGQAEPTQSEIQQALSNNSIICEVVCGAALVDWLWTRERYGDTLVIYSEKNLPAGILYFEYHYGGVPIRITLPGNVHQGENRYDRIVLPPDLQQYPQLISKDYKITLTDRTSVRPSMPSQERNSVFGKIFGKK